MEFGELAGSSRADLARVKGWLTARKDRGRDAFARNVTSAKRRCITMGTIDQNDALPIDPAGNRRWVVLPLEESAPAGARTKGADALDTAGALTPITASPAVHLLEDVRHARRRGGDRAEQLRGGPESERQHEAVGGSR